MKRNHLILPFVLASLLSTSAFAVQITVSPGASPSPTPQLGTTPGTTTGGGIAIGAGVPNTGGVAPSGPSAVAPPPGATATTTGADMAAKAVVTTNAELVAIAGLSPTSTVHVMTISANDPDLAVLTKAQSDHQADVTKLQAAISSNAAFKADLAAQNIAVNKIVAAEVTSDGSLTLYATA